MKIFQLLILLICFVLRPSSIEAQSGEQSSFESLESKADSFWYSQAYIQLLPVLKQMLQEAGNLDDPHKKIEALIQLHEYESFHTSDIQKALEYLVSAIDLADKNGLGALRLKTRAKLMFFHQSSTQNNEQVQLVLSEMININKSFKSDFYNVVLAQWSAQTIGIRRLLRRPVTEDEIKKAVSTLKETVQYFDKSKEEHQFYYQQARRNIIGYFSDYFDYATCLQYRKEINDILPIMKDPQTEIGNLIFEGAFLSWNGKFQEIIDRFEGEEKLLVTANHNMKKFYYQMLSGSYAFTGDYKNALKSRSEMHVYDKLINETAFANRVGGIRSERLSKELATRNDLLSTRNLYAIASAFLLLAGLLVAMIAWAKIKKQTSLIDRQRKDLEEINRSKNKLFGILAHDLKEPITSFSNLSKKVNYLVGKKDWERLEDMTNQLESKTSSLASILENILPWMSTQIKNPVQNLSETLLKPIILNNIDELSSKLIEKNIKVQDEVPQDLVAMINLDAFQIVLRNIMTNAIKYSERDGEVIIQSLKTKKRVSILIQDSGKGMSEGNLDNIFSEYKSTLGTIGEVGNGLGLKLSKDLMVAMNGNIEITSQVGEGTVVEVWIPIV